ncbi:S-layer homology domain-containing protein [Paenibacillus sp. HJGM_3]|uniref:S-layer homology domain-containing protein n=1 Tax=Paenibacillus sp. HJGM_3 TaxID=3379816 RepID=UPI00385EA8F3
MSNLSARSARKLLLAFLLLAGTVFGLPVAAAAEEPVTEISGVYTIGENGAYKLIGNGTITIAANVTMVTLTQSDPATALTASVSANNSTALELTISGINVRSSAGVAGLDVAGAEVTLKLAGRNSIEAYDFPGVRVPAGKSLTITGTDADSLTATGSAGIGGGFSENGGTVTILGGHVTANAGYNGGGGAGIGGGAGGTGGVTTIMGGTVTAYSPYNGAGIGGGPGGGDGGVTTITGGTVTAKSGAAWHGAGIGGGSGGDGGETTITGGIVTAKGGANASGIGGGTGGAGGITKISGGTVTATGDFVGAGIGGGNEGDGGETTITGGIVTATGGSYGAGIGGGQNGAGGTTKISGGTVTATGTDGGAGIGAGRGGAGGATITIDGGAVRANGDTSAFKNSAGVPVYLMALTVVADDTTILPNMTLSYKGSAVSTDHAGKLYLYVPAGNYGLEDLALTAPNGYRPVALDPALLVVTNTGAVAVVTLSNHYQVSWSLNGGTMGLPSVTNEVYGASVAAPSPQPLRVGYTFAGWYSDPGYSIQASFPAVVRTATAFYAKWTANELTLSGTDLPHGNYGETYNADIPEAGNGTGSYTYAITDGQLPNGLTLSGRTLSGIAEKAGSYSFEVTATDTGSGRSAKQTYTILVGPGLIVPMDDLYGMNETLVFTLIFDDEVTVSGTPAVPLTIGTGSVTRSVYATYTGERGIPLTSLTFAYVVPAGMADEDGIAVAGQLALPGGASITRVSSGSNASRLYEVPDTSGIRIVAIAPDLALQAVPDGLSREKTVRVTAAVYGETVGNTLAKLRWMAGSHSAADFTGESGTNIMAALQFTVTMNGTYTVYAKDGAGNEAIKEIEIITIATPAPDLPLDSSPTTEAVPVIDVNGVTLDPSTIDMTKPSYTLEVTPKDGAAYVSIPASILTGFEDKNASFFLEIKAPYGSYQVPVNLASLIPGLQDLLAANNLQAKDISFKITLTDKSGDKAVQTAFANGLPGGKVMGAIVDFHIDVIHTKSGQIVGAAERFSKALTRVIPMPKNETAMPAQWGAFRYNETTKTFEFVPATTKQIDGVWYVMISSYTNSVYAIAENAVSFTDVQKHWSRSFVELASAKGLVEGTGGGRFDPDTAVTRAEFTAMLVRALGLGTSAGSAAPYDDVKHSEWYGDTVAKAKELGLLDFVKGSRFSPTKPLTREEMASMLAAVVQLEKLPMTKEYTRLDGYKDIGNVNADVLEDIRLMVKLRIMTGTSVDTFSPKDESTRAQAAVVFVRTLQLLGMID